MNLELTKRDRVLLCLLLVALILGGGFYFLLRPAWARHQALVTRLGEETALSQQMESAIARRVLSETQMQEVRGEVAVESHTFYAPMDSETIHEVVAGILDYHHLDCQSLLVGPVSVQPIASGTQGAQGFTYPYRQYLVDAGEEIEDGSVPGDPGNSSTLLSAEVTASVSGATSNFLALLDDVAQRKALTLGGVTVDTKSDVSSMSLTFTLYMLDQLD